MENGGVLLSCARGPGGLIKTAIPIEHPAQQYCAGDDCPSAANINSGSVLFVNGSLDLIISPSTQTNSCGSGDAPNEQSNACFYANTPDSVEKAWATIRGADHNDVQGQPACGFPLQLELCTYGVYGYLGYPTAWMMAQLQGDAYARSAFMAGGDLYSDTSWSNQVSNIH